MEDISLLFIFKIFNEGLIYFTVQLKEHTHATFMEKAYRSIVH